MKEFRFFKDSIPDAKAFEQKLVQLVVDKDVNGAIALCRTISDVFQLAHPSAKRSVLTDINPALVFAGDKNGQALACLIKNKIPICGEGLVVIQGVDNPTSISNHPSELKYLGNYPCTHESAKKLEDKSVIFRIDGVPIHRQLMMLYRPRTSIKYIGRDFILKIAEKNSFDKSHIGTWGQDSSLVSKVDVLNICLKSLGIHHFAKLYKNNQNVNPVSVASKRIGQKWVFGASKQIFRSLKNPQADNSLIEAILKPCSRHLELIEGMNAPCDVYVSRLSNNPRDGWKDGQCGPVFDYLSHVIGGAIKMKPELVMSFLIAKVAKVIDEQDRHIFSEKFVTGIDKKLISGFLGKGEKSTDAYKLLNWSEVWQAMPAKNKREFLGDGLGI